MMNRCYFLLALLPALLFSGCEPAAEQDDCLLPFRSGRSYGYIDRDGEVVVPAQYAYTHEFSEGFGAMNVGGHSRRRHMPADGKWGFMNAQGRTVINPKFDPPPTAGLPFLLEDINRFRHDGYVFSEGKAAVVKDGRWVFIDTTGRVVIPNESFQPSFSSARRFREGLANVLIGNKWGYLNHEGRLVIPARFQYPADFQEGHALVVTEDQNWILIDREGNRILPEYRIVSNVYDGRMALMGDLKPVPEGMEASLRYWFTDSSGIRTPEEPQFDLTGHFSSGLCPVLVGSEASTDKVYYRDLTQAARRIGGKWGYVDANGVFKIEPVYDGARSFHENIAAVKKGNFWGYLSLESGMISQFEFRWAGDFDECGIARVQLGPVHADYDGHFAYFSKAGDIIWIENDIPQ